MRTPSPLAVHRQHINTVNQQRQLLDKQFARLVAEAVADGHSIVDLLAPPPEEQQEFDL